MAGESWRNGHECVLYPTTATPEGSLTKITHVTRRAVAIDATPVSFGEDGQIQGLRILVAADRAIAQELSEHILTAFPEAEFRCVQTFTEVGQVVKNWLPSLILADAALVVNNLAAMKEFAAESEYAPIVLVGEPGQLRLAEASEVAEDLIITDPTLAIRLNAKVEFILRRWHRERDRRHRSDFDHLTGLANRWSFTRRYPMLLKNAAFGGQHICALICDLNHFKLINDRLGHEVGDRVLAESAESFAGQFREGDLTCRWGGDEFVAAFAVPTPRDMLAVTKRIEESAVLAEVTVGSAGKKINVTTEFGWASAPAVSLPSMTDLVEQADVRLRRAKMRRETKGDPGLPSRRLLKQRQDLSARSMRMLPNQTPPGGRNHIPRT